MLGKLIKYEFKATARYFLPAFAVLLLMGIVGAILGLFATESAVSLTVLVLLGGLFTLAVLLVAGLAWVMAIVRFWRSLCEEEGYLMFTLPANASDHVLSKLVAAMTWTVLSGVVAAVSSAMMIFGSIGTEWVRDIEIDYLIRQSIAFISDIGGNPIILITEFVALAFLGLVVSLLTYYLAMSIGQTYNKNRVGVAVIAYIAIYTGMSVIDSLVSWGTRSALGFSTMTDPLAASIPFLNASTDSPLMMQIWLGLGILGQLAYVIALFIGTCYFLTKRLNLV